MHDEMMRLLQESGGFSRVNNYRVELTLPSNLSRFNSKLEVINLSCSSMAVPGFSLDTIESKNGPSLQPQMAHSINFQDIDLEFYVPKNFLIRELFEEWRKEVIDENTQALGYYDDYIGQIDLFPMKRAAGRDRDANALIQCTLVNAYPKQVGTIKYSYDADNQIAMLPVSFTYKNYKLV